MTQDTLGLGGGPAGLELATGVAPRGRPVALAGGETTNRTRAAGLPAHESSLK